MSSRTRSRNTIVDGSNPVVTNVITRKVTADMTGTVYAHGWPSTVANSPSTVYTSSDWTLNKSKVGLSETFTDYIGNSDGYNPCLHEKRNWVFPGISFRHEGLHTSGLKQATSVTTGTVAARSSYATLYETSWPTGWDSDANAKIRAMNGIEFGVQSAKLNLPVFLGELKDFKSFFQKSAQHLSLPTDLRNERTLMILSKYYKQLKRRPIGEALATIASADLFNAFVVQPLISDISNMMQLGKHMAAQYDKLKSSDALVARSTVIDKGSTPYYSTSTTHTLWREYSWTRTVTAYVKYRLLTADIPRPPDIILLADALGFDEPLKVVWELIPYSFLVDYFLQVGNWLDNFKGQIVDLPVEIIEQGYSVKRHYTALITQELQTGSNMVNWANVIGRQKVSGYYEYIKYQRFAEALPWGAISTPTISLPSFHQARYIIDLLYLAGRR